MKTKVIEIPVSDFKELIARIDYYKGHIEDLESTIKFLNSQIAGYNTKFTEVRDAK